MTEVQRSEGRCFGVLSLPEPKIWARLNGVHCFLVPSLRVPMTVVHLSEQTTWDQNSVGQMNGVRWIVAQKSVAHCF
jgi:hypothetical protein